MPSDTPLTDAEILGYQDLEKVEGAVDINFARELERKIQKLKRVVKEQKAEVARLNDYIKDITWHPS